MSETKYTEANIRSLDWKEHIRLRPGMYIGKLGDGSSPDDGIYILLKEVLDNSIDEFVMGAGKTIEIRIKDKEVKVRDFGRGIPLGKVVDVVSKMKEIFKNYKYRSEYVAKMLKNYVYLNLGLTIDFNGEKFFSENGLKDLLEDNISQEDMVYPVIHLRGEDIEIAITHSRTQYSEEYHSFNSIISSIKIKILPRSYKRRLCRRSTSGRSFLGFGNWRRIVLRRLICITRSFGIVEFI